MSDDVLDAFYGALLEDDADALYERAPCGYLSTTPDGTIVKVNATFLAMTGHERHEVVGVRRFADLLTGGGRIYHETHYAPMLQMQGEAREIALDLVRADGTQLPVLVNSVLERTDDGVAVVVRTAIFDATARREYERELLRAKQRAEESEAAARLLARTLQVTLIPPAPPTIPGLDVAAGYRPAGAGEEVGGDFYDVFQVAPDDWFVVVGDVQGKGVDAAVVTALARHTVRGAAMQDATPSRVLHALNLALCRSDADRFCTIALVRLRRDDGRWTATVSLGGHAPPLLRRSGEVVGGIGAFGSAVGMFDDVEHVDEAVVLEPGDAILVFTDGVTEGIRDGVFFGDNGLRAAIARHTGAAADTAAGVLEEIVDFQRGDPRDDIAIVVVCVP